MPVSLAFLQCVYVITVLPVEISFFSVPHTDSFDIIYGAKPLIGDRRSVSTTLHDDMNTNSTLKRQVSYHDASYDSIP